MLEILIKILGCGIQLYVIFALSCVYYVSTIPEDELRLMFDDDETIKSLRLIMSDPKRLAFMIGIWFSFFLIGWFIAFRIYEW